MIDFWGVPEDELKILLSQELHDHQKKSNKLTSKKKTRSQQYHPLNGKRIVISDVVGKAIGDRYDPNARDGDSDGTVQEGTSWERPATARNPKGRGGRIRRAASRALDRLKPSRRRRRLRDGLGDIGDRGDMSAQERAQSLGKRPLNRPGGVRRGAESPMPSEDETPEELIARLESQFQQMRENDLFEWLGSDDDRVDETPEDLLASLEQMFNELAPLPWENNLPKDGFTPANLTDPDERDRVRKLLNATSLTDQEIEQAKKASREELIHLIQELRDIAKTLGDRSSDPDNYTEEALAKRQREWEPNIYRTYDFSQSFHLNQVANDLENHLDATDSTGSNRDDLDVAELDDPESAALWNSLERVIETENARMEQRRKKLEGDQRLARSIFGESEQKPRDINKLEIIPEPDSPWSDESGDWAEEYMNQFSTENPEVDWENGLFPTNDVEEDSWMYDDMDDPGTEEWGDDFTVRVSPPKPISGDPPDGIPQELWDAYRDDYLFSDEPFDDGPPPLWDRQLSFVGWLAREITKQGAELEDIDRINYLHNLRNDGFEIVPLDEIEPIGRLDDLAAQLERLFEKNPEKWDGVFPMLVAGRYLVYRKFLERYGVRYRDPEKLGERIPGGLKPLTLEEFAERLYELESPD